MHGIYLLLLTVGDQLLVSFLVWLASYSLCMGDNGVEFKVMRRYQLSVSEKAWPSSAVLTRTSSNEASTAPCPKRKGLS